MYTLCVICITVKIDADVIVGTIEAVGYGIGQAYVRDNEHSCIFAWHFECTCTHDEISRLVVVLFIHDHNLMLQHDNAQPHVERIGTQVLEAQNSSVQQSDWRGKLILAHILYNYQFHFKHVEWFTFKNYFFSSSVLLFNMCVCKCLEALLYSGHVHSWFVIHAQKRLGGHIDR